MPHLRNRRECLQNAPEADEFIRFIRKTYREGCGDFLVETSFACRSRGLGPTIS